MVRRFKKSKILLSVAEGKIYDDTTNFNEDNIKEYLAEVEEYIKCLLGVMGKNFKFSCPLLTAIGLEELPEKIEAPIFPKDNIINSKDSNDVDDTTLMDMLDKSKFEKMIIRIYTKNKNRSFIGNSK